MLGLACAVMLLAEVATKFTFMLAEGVPPGPVAVMMEGPEAPELMFADAVPAATVLTGLPVTVPRLAVKVTADPDTGTPAFVHRIEIGVVVLTLIWGVAPPAAGAVKLKLALLMVRFWVCDAPAAVAVMTSFPAAMTVTVAVMTPLALVMPVVGESAMVLPVFDVTVTGTEATGFPAESFTLMVSGLVAPNAIELFPLKERTVPVTLTVFVAVLPSTVALTVMVRLALFPPRLSWAVTSPLLSVTLSPLILLTKAVASPPVEKVTVLPGTTWPVAFSAIAVRVMALVPEDDIWGLLTKSCMELAVVLVVVAAAGAEAAPPELELPLPPPQPPRTASIAAIRKPPNLFEWIVRTKSPFFESSWIGKTVP